MANMTEYKSLFLEEVEEQLQVMEEEILLLEQEGGSAEGVQRLFRAAHTLKGSSAAMGYGRMKQLTHAMESLLDQVRSGEFSVTSELATLFFRCVDRMKLLQAEIAADGDESSEIDDLAAELNKLGNSRMPENVKQAEAGQQVRSPFLLEDDKLDSARKQAAAGMSLFRVEIRLSADCLMKSVRWDVIDAQLREAATVVWSEIKERENQASPDDEDKGCWLIASVERSETLAEEIRSWFDIASAEVTPCSLQELEPRSISPSVGEEDKAVREKASGSSGASGVIEKTKAQTIRVNVERLEHLMNLVGELVIDQTRIRQVEGMLGQKFGSDESVQEMGYISDHLTRVIGELQESVMKVRMLPIEQLFNRFPRLVRDLANTLGNEVELVLEGKETELDRTLIEEIGDPLIHIIRNAVDHGIETPEARVRAGKPEKGTLRIVASHEDNQVIITVEDDGAGIDTEKLLAKAIDNQLIPANEAQHYTEREAINLIFHPGLSTAPEVSDISGRGVGMDIVRAGIERINGMIEVEAHKGRGTRFRIRLPLTLAIITGLMVDLAGRIYILPMSNVVEIIRMAPREIRTAGGVPVVTLRDQVIPVVWLHDAFGYPRTSGTRKQIPMVIVGRAEKRMALAVDELHGYQEVVIKTLGAFVGKTEGISGATILGNGQVALILEIGGIMKIAGGQSGRSAT
ncbi:chemotaxis protein CheA [Cohnella sp. CFH 77786]|uniref:chemotaxis protein CheA n=1 Tax=Cohnella sp. CFH 77786 TaxID=2662265 RepID=UPI001C60874E|nr:chemotaxis protein CheA [Cohnella sp. CFH 77786]MBW5449312.1 chemotaxis protein CheA [Cohnella sp. CFH 77786]